jgi:hypothetical protein
MVRCRAAHLWHFRISAKRLSMRWFLSGAVLPHAEVVRNRTREVIYESVGRVIDLPAPLHALPATAPRSGCAWTAAPG